MKSLENKYDVLVVGAGVAGVHAAFAAARHGADTLLVTSSWETAAGPGWGPRFSDTEKLRARTLGVGSTDPPAAAVRRSLIFRGGPGADGAAFIDCSEFQGFWRYHLEKSAAITIFQDTCESLLPVDDGWVGETGWGVTVKAKAVVLAVGTFLGSRVSCGNGITPGGRPGEAGAENLEACLSALGVELREKRWWGGPIFDGRSIQWRHAGTASAAPETASPRPVFWADGREARGAYLEPINKNHDQYYLRVRESDWLGCGEEGAGPELRIAGLEKARVMKPGFSVFAGCVSRELVNMTTLKHEKNDGLFLAGRIIGTDSYGESAHQGLTAGAAAAAVSRGTS